MSGARKHRESMASMAGRLREAAVKAIPTTWLDSLLTGPDAVIGKPPYGVPDIEKLLSAVRDRVREAVK